MSWWMHWFSHVDRGLRFETVKPEQNRRRPQTEPGKTSNVNIYETYMKDLSWLCHDFKVFPSWWGLTWWFVQTCFPTCYLPMLWCCTGIRVELLAQIIQLVRMPCSFTKSKSAEPQLCNMSLRPWSLFELCLKRFAANTFIEWSYGAPANSFFSPKDLFLLSQFEQTSRERTWYLLPSRNFLWHYLYFVAEERIAIDFKFHVMPFGRVFLCLAGQVSSLSQHHRALWRGRRHLKSFSQSKRPTPWIQLGGFFCPQSIVALCIAGVLSCGLQVSELEFSKAKTLMNQSRPTPPQPTPQLLPETQAETGTAGILTWWLEWLESLDLRSLQMISASHQVPSLAGGVLLNQHGVTWWSC